MLVHACYVWYSQLDTAILNKNYDLLRQLLSSRQYHLHYLDPQKNQSWWESISKKADLEAMLIICESMDIEQLPPHMSMLHWCVREDFVDKVEGILRNYPKMVNLKHPDKSIPLHFVRSISMLDILVRYGSNLSAKDDKHYTPLHEIVMAIRNANEINVMLHYLMYTDRHFWEELDDQQEFMLQIVDVIFRYHPQPYVQLSKMMSIFIDQNPTDADFFQKLMVSAPRTKECDSCVSLQHFIRETFSIKKRVYESQMNESFNQFLILNR
mmetsp:Transcript_13434/g.20302  ORF Transcript_13434/g.20302 Transcript_13434/m.20302 type:complete len:268 (+) Transcript_13434:297-1100(+)